MSVYLACCFQLEQPQRVAFLNRRATLYVCVCVCECVGVLSLIISPTSNKIVATLTAIAATAVVYALLMTS